MSRVLSAQKPPIALIAGEELYRNFITLTIQLVLCFCDYVTYSLTRVARIGLIQKDSCF